MNAREKFIALPATTGERYRAGVRSAIAPRERRVPVPSRPVPKRKKNRSIEQISDRIETESLRRWARILPAPATTTAFAGSPKHLEVQENDPYDNYNRHNQLYQGNQCLIVCGTVIFTYHWHYYPGRYNIRHSRENGNLV